MNCSHEEETLASGPVWLSEPFRILFPVGLLAAIFGLLLWPMHYFGWWPVYPAIQHPRILVFGFGAAFVFGFLGTAWPRFVEAPAFRAWELIPLVAAWTCGQVAYAKVAIRGGDWFLGAALLWFLCLLAVRTIGKQRDLPPAGFVIAYLGVAIGALVAFGWALGWNLASPGVDYFLRLLAYQGFLLLPILGVGSFLFLRFFPPSSLPTNSGLRGFFLWSAVLVLLGSFAIEAFGSVRWGNLIRICGLLLWAFGVVKPCFLGRAGATRPWARRIGLGLIAVAYLCRAIWPHEIFAFEHILFLAGFSQVMLLVADRVAVGHGGDPGQLRPKSGRWRWIVWLLLLTAATRAAADLVPSTRISHHIYAAVMLIIVFGIWWWENGKRLRTVAREDAE